MFRERILILLLETQLLDLAGPELLEQGDRPGTIGKQVEARVGIEGDLDCTIVNPIIDPVRLDPQAPRDLADSQAAGDPPRVRLAPLPEPAMAEPEEADRAGQHGRVVRRAMPLLAEDGRDLLVRLAHSGAAEGLFLPLLRRRDPSQRA